MKSLINLIRNASVFSNISLTQVATIWNPPPRPLFFTYAKPFFGDKDWGSGVETLGKKFDIFNWKSRIFHELSRIYFMWKLNWRIMNIYVENLDAKLQTNWKNWGPNGRSLRLPPIPGKKFELIQNTFIPYLFNIFSVSVLLKRERGGASEIFWEIRSKRKFIFHWNILPFHFVDQDKENCWGWGSSPGQNFGGMW